MLLVNGYGPFLSVSLWPVRIAAYASPPILLCASILALLRRRFGYVLALAGALIVLPWFALTENLLECNSWTLVSYQDWMFPQKGSVFLISIKLRILSTALIVTVTALSSLRLLPVRWSIGGMPLYRRTWPAFAIGFLLMAIWFVHSVTPYRVPGYSRHAPEAEFRILHVVKRGMLFHETSVIAFRNRKIYITRADRSLFQYQFTRSTRVIELASTTNYDEAIELANSAELSRVRTPMPTALRSWNAEGWYLIFKDSRLLAFTTEYGTIPPDQVRTLFDELDKSPASESIPVGVRDMCLGWCYDPIAALGFSTLEERTDLLSRTATHQR